MSGQFAGAVVVPEEDALVGFFGTEAEHDEAEHDERTFVRFRVRDASGVGLVFSYDLIERSVQTIVEFDGRIVQRVSHECLTAISVDAEALRAVCDSTGVRTVVEIELRKGVCVCVCVLELVGCAMRCCVGIVAHKS